MPQRSKKSKQTGRMQLRIQWLKNKQNQPNSSASYRWKKSYQNWWNNDFTHCSVNESSTMNNIQATKKITEKITEYEEHLVLIDNGETYTAITKVM